jgi:hypothetical protein
MGRLILGILAGAVAGIALQSLLAWLANLVFPVAANPFDRQQVAEAYAGRPAAAAILGIGIYLLSAFAAAYTARLVGRRAVGGWIAGGIVAAMALVLAIVYPEPIWGQFGALVAALLGMLLGCHAPLRAAEAPAGADDARS